MKAGMTLNSIRVRKMTDYGEAEGHRQELEEDGDGITWHWPLA
jgi:hypothetical protein